MSRQPIPRKQVRQARLRCVGDARQHVGEPSERVDGVELGRGDQGDHCSSAIGAAFGAGEEPRLPAKCKAAQRALCRIVREADPAVIKEAREGVPALEHVVDRLGDRCRARQPGALLAKPLLKRGHERRAALGSRTMPLFGAEPVDVALDLEQRVDAFGCRQSMPDKR